MVTCSSSISIPAAPIAASNFCLISLYNAGTFLKPPFVNLSKTPGFGHFEGEFNEKKDLKKLQKQSPSHHVKFPRT
jgi:hypothetical protein